MWNKKMTSRSNAVQQWKEMEIIRGDDRKRRWNGVNFRLQKIEAQRGLSASQGIGH